MDNNAELIRLLESKRDYINSLENKFADEFGYGFGPYIEDERKFNPNYNFYDHVTEPIYNNDLVSDQSGNPLTLNPKSNTFDDDLEEYIYNYLLDTNPYD